MQFTNEKDTQQKTFNQLVKLVNGQLIAMHKFNEKKIHLLRNHIIIDSIWIHLGMVQSGSIPIRTVKYLSIQSSLQQFLFVNGF